MNLSTERDNSELEWIELRIFTDIRDQVVEEITPVLEKLDDEWQLKYIHILHEPWAPLLLRLYGKKAQMKQELERVLEPLEEKRLIRIEEPDLPYRNYEEESKLIQGLKDPKLSPVELIDIGSRWGLLFRKITAGKIKIRERPALFEMALLLHFVVNNLGFGYLEETDIHQMGIRQILLTLLKQMETRAKGK